MIFLIFFATASFFIGGVPTGLLISRLYGKDPRKEGSKNIGATNVFRTVGPIPGFITFILDIFKGFLPVVAAKIVSGMIFSRGSFFYEFTPAITALAAVLGHIFSPYLKFRGGKGVATGLGTIIVLTPLLSGVCFCIFALLMAVFRIVSVGSIISALSYAALLTAIKYFALPYDLSEGELYYGLTVAFFVLITHRKNISRLFRGQEKKINWKKNR